MPCSVLYILLSFILTVFKLYFTQFKINSISLKFSFKTVAVKPRPIKLLQAESAVSTLIIKYKCEYGN